MQYSISFSLIPKSHIIHKRCAMVGLNHVGKNCATLAET